MKDNIVLIGMPGAGKSTVGVVLAKRLGYRFVDSDLVIQEKYDRLLHELIEEHGVEGFWKIEEEVNASLKPRKSVYLKLPLEDVAERLGDLNARGVTLMPGQTLADLYEERIPLYEKYAHEVIECHGIPIREVVHRIAALN